MKKYLVTWEIDVEADSPKEAAQQALTIHRKPDSIATVFEVKNKESGKEFTVDLTNDIVRLNNKK